MSNDIYLNGIHIKDKKMEKILHAKLTDWHEELQEFIKELGFRHSLNSKDLLTFFTATLCGQFALAGLPPEFVKVTLEQMFESYLKIKERIESEKN